MMERPGWSGRPSARAIVDRHQRGVGDRRQIHVPHPIAELVRKLGRDLYRQPRFAHPAGSGQGHQPVFRQQLAHLGQLRAAPDEASELHRKSWETTAIGSRGAAGTR